MSNADLPTTSAIKADKIATQQRGDRIDRIYFIKYCASTGITLYEGDEWSISRRVEGYSSPYIDIRHTNDIRFFHLFEREVHFAYTLEEAMEKAKEVLDKTIRAREKALKRLKSIQFSADTIKRATN